jgi:hypothetical protein
MGLRVSYKKKIWESFFFASIKSLKKGVGSRVEFGSISQRYGSDLHQNVTDPHQNVPDPQHWFPFISESGFHYNKGAFMLYRK